MSPLPESKKAKFGFGLIDAVAGSPVDLAVRRYSGPPISTLDEKGRRLFFRGCDLVARFWLNDHSMPEFDAENFEGMAMLVHAERYLCDRLAYELAPWPKGKLKIESDDSYALPAKAGL